MCKVRFGSITYGQPPVDSLSISEIETNGERSLVEEKKLKVYGHKKHVWFTHLCK